MDKYNLMALADSLKQWTSPAMKQIYVAAQHKTSATIITDVIVIFGFILVCFLTYMIFRYLKKLDDADELPFNMDDEGVIVLGVVSIIALIIYFVFAIIIVFDVVNIIFSTDYETIKNVIKLVR